MAEANGANGHAKPDTIFAHDTVDAGDIPGLGHVVIHEAALKDIWPYMTTTDGNASTFGLRLVAASIEIDGRRFTFEEVMNFGMKHLTQLQTLLPTVRRINGLELDVDDDDEKKEVAAGTGTTPAA